MWTLIENTFNPAVQNHKETIFTIGNGYLSTRGALEEGYPGESRATFVHGMFDTAPTVFTELANAPDWLSLQIVLNGQKFSLAHGSILEYQRELDLRSGVLARRVRWQSPTGDTAVIQFERFSSLAQPHLLYLRCQVTPQFNGSIHIRAALNAHVDNLGLRHWKVVGQQQIAPDTVYLQTVTRQTGIQLAQIMRLLTAHPALEYWDAEGQPTLNLNAQAQPGETITVTKIVSLATSRDSEDPLHLAQEQIAAVLDWQTALEAQKQAWAEEWKRCEISIEGDEEAELAARFSLFQLLIAAPRQDNRVSIGAKTLSGFGYRGHAFWDTEIFMLPVFTFTAPHIARNLLDYRYLTLPAARQKARQSGYEGAWFAWESADTGEEVTPIWVPDFNDQKKLARVWTGDLALHISADVAYGAWQYWRVSGDDAWFVERGAELILDTAKFFASRAEWQPERGCYAYNDVLGPDEYHDHVNNNAYTNRMAQWNLRTACDTLAWIREHYPQKVEHLTHTLALTPERLALWRKVAETICLSTRPDHVIEQFDGFFSLQDVNLADYEPRTKSMHEIFGIEAANHYQVVKQPDVLMMQYLLRDEYLPEQMRANYEYYTPRTDHTYGSSLGPAVQAILACLVGKVDEAYEHFMRAARADMHDVRGNAGDGIHAASAGGLWQAIVFGFAGLHIHADGRWETHPHLPAHWKRLTFRFTLHDRQQVVNLEHG